MNFRKEAVILKYFVLQLPVAVVSSILYARVGSKLMEGKTNARKRNLTIAFFVLWVLWLVLSLLYAFYEIYQTFWGEFGMIEDLLRFEELTSANRDYPDYNDDPSPNYFAEISLFTLKQSFGFFNSLILIVLIRPFQQPILACIGKLRCRKNK